MKMTTAAPAHSEQKVYAQLELRNTNEFY